MVQPSAPDPAIHTAPAEQPTHVIDEPEPRVVLAGATRGSEPPNLSPVRMAGLIGAGMAVGAFTADAGLPPLRMVLDPIIWFSYAILALIGAFFGISALLAWRHVRASHWWLLATLLGVLLLSQPVVSRYVRTHREMQHFLATADSTRGVVADKYVRGGVNLIVEYRVHGQGYRVRPSRPIHWWGAASYSEWRRGDSIRVYYQAGAPKTVLVGYRTPDRHALFESLAIIGSVWGLLLTAYLPPVARGLLRRLQALRRRLRGAGP